MQSIEEIAQELYALDKPYISSTDCFNQLVKICTDKNIKVNSKCSTEKCCDAIKEYKRGMVGLLDTSLCIYHELFKIDETAPEKNILKLDVDFSNSIPNNQSYNPYAISHTHSIGPTIHSPLMIRQVITDTLTLKQPAWPYFDEGLLYPSSAAIGGPIGISSGDYLILITQNSKIDSFNTKVKQKLSSIIPISQVVNYLDLSYAIQNPQQSTINPSNIKDVIIVVDNQATIIDDVYLEQIKAFIIKPSHNHQFTVIGYTVVL